MAHLIPGHGKPADGIDPDEGPVGGIVDRPGDAVARIAAEAAWNWNLNHLQYLP